MVYGHRNVRKLQPKNLAKLEKIKQILASGPKTVRRVFYMLASGTYNPLSKLLVWARLHGKISWGKIREEGRHLEGSQEYNTVEEFLNKVAELYVKKKEESFKNYFEVWLEKATLRDVFYPITDKYGVGLLITRGRNSWTALYNASKRLDSDSTILYFGDNDTHGVEMFDQNKEFLAMFGCNPKFIRLALTDAQEAEFDFPEGEHHLDGMPEDSLAELLEASVRKQIDIKKFDALLEEETQGREEIRELVE